MDIGKAINEIRKAKKISRRELSQRAGISVTALYNIECGTSMPTKKNLSAIADGLMVSVASLMVHSLTEEDVAVEKRQAFRFLVEPLKAFLDNE